MKGVVLAGGLGTRLLPLTKVTNKHLLPVYNKPMIFYPIQTLVNAGVTEIMLVTGGNNAGDFLKLLGNGPERATLERFTGNGIELVGWRSDEEIRDLYRTSIAAILPGEEDFGIVPVEAQACGRPVAPR